MIKKLLTINGTDIAYIEQNPSAPDTIFFIHGNSYSSLTWKKQFNSHLLSGYRLIAIDLPGHGESGPSQDPAKGYTLSGLASAVAEVLIKLVAGPYILCGVSLGTNIMAEMIPLGIQPGGILFAGPCIIGEGVGLEKIALPGADLSVFFSDGADQDAVAQYRGLTSLSDDVNDHEDFFHAFASVQSPFRSTFMNTFVNGNMEDQIAQVKTLSCPLAWVFGADEKVADPHYLDDVNVPKWKEQVFRIPGASHLVNVDQPDAFNSILATFAEDSIAINSIIR